jgi:hypothetical protein
MQFQCSRNIFIGASYLETPDVYHSRLVLVLSAHRRSSQLELKHVQFFSEIKICLMQGRNRHEVHHSRHECNGRRFYIKKKKLEGKTRILIECRHNYMMILNYIMIRDNYVHVEEGWLLKYTTRTHYSV